jgi:hypothetical protein
VAQGNMPPYAVPAPKHHHKSAKKKRLRRR